MAKKPNKKQTPEQEGSGAAAKQKPYTPHGFFWRVFSVCLAFVLGMFAVVAAFVVAGTAKTRWLLEMLNLDAGVYLKEDYLDKNVLDFYADITKDLNEHGIDSLGAITKYTPYLDKYLDDLDSTLATFGITLDRQGLLDTKLADFGTYFLDDVMPTIALGPILQLNKHEDENKNVIPVTIEAINSNAPMYAIAYGKYGVDYTIEDGDIKMLGESKPMTAADLLPFMDGSSSNGIMDILGSFELGSLLGLDIVLPSEKVNENGEETDNSMFYALCYGSESVDYVFEEQSGGVELLKPVEGGKNPAKIKDLMTDVNGYINGISLGDLLGLGAAKNLENRAQNALLYTLCYGAEGVDYAVENGKLTLLAGGKAPTTIGTLTSGSNSFLNDLALGEMLGLNTAEKVADRAGSNALMYALCYGTEGVDYTVNAQGLIEMIEGHTATTVGELTEGSNDLINGLVLGEMLGLNTAEKVADRAGNALMYSLCYGTEGVDYTVNEQGLIEMIEGHAATTVGSLTESSNDLINGLTLGEMLGLNTAEKVADRANNALMYSLCYGTEGVDYTVNEQGLIEMTAGHTATTVGELTESSNDLINGMEVDALLDVKPESDAVIRYVAYGPELPKENGEYVKNDDGNGYKTEQDPANPEKLRYAGGGRYIIEEQGGTKSIKMLPDPNDLSKTYAKKTVGDLTAEDANLLEGMTIGSIVAIDENSSSIMQAMKDWTIDDLSDQSMIESLKIGDILEIDGNSSGIMKALQDKSLADLKNQETIEGIKIGEIMNLELSESAQKPADASGIMWALRNKTIADLNKQETINGLVLGDILEIDDSSSGIMRALRDKSIGDLNDQRTINDLVLGDILDIKANEDGGKPDDVSNIMWALRDKSIADLNKQETIDNLVLGDILDIGDSSSAIMQAMKGWHLSDLNDEDKIGTLKIGDLMTIDGSSAGVMQAMKNWTIGDLNKQGRIDRLKIGQILSIDGSSSALMQAMKDWRVSDLTDQKKIDSLTLGDVINVDPDGPAILQALSGMSLGEISTGIDSLTLEEVLGEEQFSGDGVSDILKALRHVKISGMGDAISSLTVHDVFGDEVYSFAKKNGYDENERVSEDNKVQKDAVKTHYYQGETEVFAGWYKGSDEMGWTKVDDASVKHESYVEEKVYVTREVGYLVVDYDKPASEWQSFSGSEEIKRDDVYSLYYLDAEGVRHDLEEVVTYKKDGAPVTDKRILTEDGGDAKYYYLEKVSVSRRYAASNSDASYAEDQITEKYYSGSEEVTLYYAGVWYLLLGDSETGANTRLTELGSLVTGVAAKINTLNLHAMYAHELVESDPSTDITKLYDLGWTDKTDLDEMTISEITAFVQTIVSKVASYPFL